VDLASLAELITAVLSRREDVLEAYLFGSRARGDAQPHSDVDVAVFLAPSSAHDEGFGIDAELGAALMGALETNRVDVVLLNRADPVLYHRVLRDGIRLLARDLRATTTREGRALSRYCDFVPQLRKADAARAARMGAGRFGH
jgi:predicted nucleotidyltransferase